MTPSTTSTSNPAQGSASTAEEVKAQTRDVAGTAKSEAAKVGQEVRSQTSRLIGEMGSKGRERADNQLSGVAGSLGQMSDELDRMAEGSSQPDGYLVGFVREGSSVARRLSDRLDQDGLDGALREVKRFARRQPVAFLAGAFAAGVILGRLTRNADFSSIAEAAGSGNGASGDLTESADGLPSGVGGDLPSSTFSDGETSSGTGVGGTSGIGTGPAGTDMGGSNSGLGSTGTGSGTSTGSGVGGTGTTADPIGIAPGISPTGEPAP